MKKILQDLSYAETEEMTLALGEKNSAQNSFSRDLPKAKPLRKYPLFRKRLRKDFASNTKTRPYGLRNGIFRPMVRKSIYSSLPTAT
jgi:hypothetical protein